MNGINWKELVFKIIVAVVSVILGSTQYAEHKEHKQEQAKHQVEAVQHP